MFMSLRGGLQQLANAIDRALARRKVVALRLLRARRSVLTPTATRFVLSDGGSIIADDIVFATPSYVTADLVQQIDPMLASRLRAIRYVSTATVSLGFKRSEITHPMQGAGFIVPSSEGRRITACSWSSEKFDHRAPGRLRPPARLHRRRLAEDLAEQNEAALVASPAKSCSTIMGITATPCWPRPTAGTKPTRNTTSATSERIAEIERTLSNVSRPVSRRRRLPRLRHSRLHSERDERRAVDRRNESTPTIPTGTTICQFALDPRRTSKC
jgi:oxygen-dependent protoporphyrinogen oxidase